MSRGSIGTGIVGFGKMGEWHAGLLRDARGFRAVAACDAAAGRRSFAENEYGLKSYAALANLLEDDDVELVVVATPSSSHAEVTVQALRAGKHVVVEKPMCMNAAEADSMMKTARRARRTLTVFQNRRWDPSFRTALKVVKSGRLGKVWRVKLAHWVYSDVMLRYGVKEFRPQPS